MNTLPSSSSPPSPPSPCVHFSKNPKPKVKPLSANFGSGPCKKRPGYSLSELSEISLGRSHRSKLGKERLKEAIEHTKRLLQLPKEYLLGIVPGSDTGAFEMAMWNLLGPRPIDIFHWESFGHGWFKDIIEELQIDQVHEYTAPFGEIPDLSKANGQHDIVFTWNGTTSGVCVPNGDWIPKKRQGLVLNDATSAAFAMEIPWEKIDVCTFSWQKVLGGEAAHGILILSPRAVERLEQFVPQNRPMPKIFKLTKNTLPFGRKIAKEIFEGSTINTPSMLCVEDYLDALRWAESVGGIKGLIEISKQNLKIVEEFVAENNRWIKFLPINEQIRSNTSVCLLIEGLDKTQVNEMVKLLEKEQVAFDIGSYRDAPPGIRIWCGATVETKDLEKLMPWLKWAYLEIKDKEQKTLT
jgi:phosphoserine aminotransferase